MEGKTMVKLSHVVAFLLLASLFKPLTAQDLVLNGSDEEIEVLRLPQENENQALDDSQSFCKGKQMWPELIGVPAKLAKERIEKEKSSVKVQIILNGSPVTADFSCDRVRLFVNILDFAVQIPVVG